jgi:hypothetical protein
MFVGLVLGVGILAFPLMTRSVAPPDLRPTSRDYASLAAHSAAALALAGSFFWEEAGAVRLAFLLRAGIVLAVLLGCAELWRPPDQPGNNRRLVWLAGWMLPLGYLLAAAWPAHATAGLHVVFIGCFATLALAVGAQVTLGHGGYRDVMTGSPWPVVGIGAAMGAATVARVLMEADRPRYLLWMAVASGCFLAATLLWLGFLVPKILAPRSGS